MKLFLLDASGIAYKAYFALIRNPLYTSDGRNTSAVFGFIRMFLKMLKEHKPEAIAVVFDSPVPTFRHKAYVEYKATRPKAPDELKRQIPVIKELVKSFGVKLLEVPGFEADDVIATLVARLNSEKFFIISGDKDILQLVNEKNVVIRPRKGLSEIKYYSREDVKEEYGVWPEQIPDYLALVGDEADNIPGVPGVGDKTARALLEQFKNLEEIYQNMYRVDRPKLRDTLLKYKDQAFQSRQLAILRKDAPVEISDVQQLVPASPDWDRIHDIFIDLEFKSLLSEIPSRKQVVQVVSKKGKYFSVTDEASLNEILNKIQQVDTVAFDTETTSKDVFEAQIIGISLSWREGEACYIPFVPHAGSGYLNFEKTFEKITKVLSEKTVVGHNIKYDINVLKTAGRSFPGKKADSMIASYVLDPGRTRHSLDVLAFQYLDYQMLSYRSLVGKEGVLSNLPLDKVTFYSGEDADITLRLWNLFEKELHQKDLDKLFWNLEMPLVDVLADMEYTGVLIDPEHFRKLSVEMAKKMQSLESEIYKLAGTRFNINSTQQLRVILFDKLKLPPKKKTKTGFSTDIEVLEELSSLHPLPGLIVKYRQLAKLKSTYVDALPTMVHPKTGRVHASFNQTVAATGRLSSSDPNLQNIPVRGEYGKEIREGFIASEGCKLASFDYSQIELRLVAHLSGDPALVKAFMEGRDIHTATASFIFNVPPEKVTPDMRRVAKAVNFGVIYGISPYGLATQLKISQAEAKNYIETYFNKHPKVKEFVEEMVRKAKETGYAETILGRRRYIPEINTSNPVVAKNAARIAVNTPVQGSAADLIKLAMVDIYNWLKTRKTKMIIQVHDELIFEVPEEEIAEVKERVKEKMENAMKLNIPIVVDVAIGKNWGELK